MTEGRPSARLRFVRPWPWFAVLTAVLAAGCGPAERTEREERPETPETTREAAGLDDNGEERMAGDMVLRLFDESPGADGARRPVFTVSSPQFSHEGGGRWLFRDASAVILDPGGEEILLRAASGRMNQETREAWLEGDVTLQAEDMAMELQDVEWVNEDRVARSGKPLRVAVGETRFEASAMELWPDENRLRLTDVRGSIHLKGFEEEND